MIIKCGKCGVQLRVEEAKLHPVQPAVKCPNCQTINRLKLPDSAAPTPPPIPSLPQGEATMIFSQPASTHAQELGWLIVHDEQAPTQTFPLKLGENIIGRKSTSQPADLMIETQDRYMSRHHCVLRVALDQRGQYQYLLADLSSTNGTFMLAKNKRLTEFDEIFLRDGDTMQAGRTKLVLKTLQQSRTAANALHTVIHTDYAKTIIQ
jgi:predicted Zn finger-like uncharacterized protein